MAVVIPGFVTLIAAVLCSLLGYEVGTVSTYEIRKILSKGHFIGFSVTRKITRQFQKDIQIY